MTTSDAKTPCVSRRFYAVGTDIYIESIDSDGNQTNRWYASTQGEEGTSPTARELDDAALIVQAVNAHDALLEACREIAKGEGAFSRDPLTHATNCIDGMKALATAAIAGAEGQHG